MYGYPESIVIRHLLHERVASAAPVRPTPSAEDRHPLRWLVAVVVAPVVLAVLVAALLLTTGPARAGSAAGIDKAQLMPCPQTTGRNGCSPWVITSRSAHGARTSA